MAWLSIVRPAAVAAAMSLTACASGGGGSPPPASSGVVTPPPGTPTTPQNGPSALAPAPPLPANAAAFTTFSALPATVSIPGIGVATTISNYFASSGQSWSPPQAEPQSLILTSQAPATAWVQTPNRLIGADPQDGPVAYSVNGLGLKTYGYPYSAIDGYKGVTFAQPTPADLDYQTFGWWWSRDDSSGSPAFAAGGFSVGAATPGAAIPASGSAVFTGRLAANLWLRSQGLVTDDVSAPMSLSVDFAARAAGFSSSDWVGAQTYAGTGLHGQLTYAGQQNALSGTLTSANGQWSGQATAQFYGPAAQEVGGAFVLAPTGGGVDRAVGGFGAKR